MLFLLTTDELIELHDQPGHPVIARRAGTGEPWVHAATREQALAEVLQVSVEAAGRALSEAKEVPWETVNTRPFHARVRCPGCEKEFETFYKNDDRMETCPHCGLAMEMGRDVVLFGTPGGWDLWRAWTPADSYGARLSPAELEDHVREMEHYLRSEAWRLVPRKERPADEGWRLISVSQRERNGVPFVEVLFTLDELPDRTLGYRSYIEDDAVMELMAFQETMEGFLKRRRTTPPGEDGIVWVLRDLDS